MGMTLTQKILANSANEKSVKAGDFITANLDIVLGDGRASCRERV